MRCLVVGHTLAVRRSRSAAGVVVAAVAGCEADQAVRSVGCTAPVESHY